MLPDESAAARDRMLAEQIEGRGVHDPLVLQAMRRVPRERFVPAAHAVGAYADQALPIGHGQTISQPYMVALMVAQLGLRGGEKVLEVGTGSGYQAAVLAEIAGEVHTVERVASLAADARARLADLGYARAHVHDAGPSLGWHDDAPYDAIIVAAGARSFPDSLFRQVVDGGRLVVPIGDRPSQTLIRCVRHGDRKERRRICSCAFVPLIGESGWEPSDAPT